jgi:dienelactone hydrolase
VLRFLWDIALDGRLALQRSNWSRFKISRRAFLKAATVSVGSGALWGCADNWVVGNRVIARDIREDELVGTLFLPTGAGPFPAVITLTGADGGIEEPPALGLAQQGFAAFALATHGVRGLPRGLREIPLEYCERAIAWLRMTVRPANDFIAVRGWSRGGELALILGAMFPAVKTVLAYAPRTYVGLAAPRPDDFGDPSAPAAWTWQGKPLSFEPLPRAMMADPAHPTLEDRFGIPIERTKGSILFVSGTEDEGISQDPTIGCDRAMRRLDLFGFRYRHEHWIYPGAGHDIEGPPPFDGAAEGGGTVEGDRRAVADSWPRSIVFLRAAAS